MSVGQVHTTWTFAHGLRAPLIFEVLEECCHDVLLDNDIFELDAASIITLPVDTDHFSLGPFRFLSKWQQNLSDRMHHPITNRKGT